MLRQRGSASLFFRVSENNMKNQKSALAQHSQKEMMHTQLNPDKKVIFVYFLGYPVKKWCNHVFFYQVIQSLDLSS